MTEQESERAAVVRWLTDWSTSVACGPPSERYVTGWRQCAEQMAREIARGDHVEVPKSSASGVPLTRIKA